ncbi:MAG: hypothetical protein KAF40_00350 [Flavihumibacter sp.]|nr:hypothetical protein [Flavihumibacter sp.]
MKLIYFSSQTLPKQGGGNKKPTISFGKKGMISINSESAKLVGLKHGDKITIAQDESEPENWYLFKDTHHGFELRNLSDEKSLGFNHIALVSTFREAMDLDSNKSHKFPLAIEPTVMKGDKTQYFGIILLPGK